MASSQIYSRRIAVVFPMVFESYHVYKDPGLIPLGLVANGAHVTLYCVKNNATEKNFPIVEASLESMATAKFWREQEIGGAIIYTWLAAYGKVTEALKSAGALVIQKGDSDGLISAKTHTLALLKRMVLMQTTGLNKLKAAGHFVRRYLYLDKPYLQAIHENLAAADFSVLETSGSCQNVADYLDSLGHKDLSAKLRDIPNPVEASFLRAVQPTSKTARVFAVGRWDDPQKGRKRLIEALCCVNRKNPDFICVIAGSDKANEISEAAKAWPWVKFVGELGREQIREQMEKAQVILFSSVFEGMPISAGEALCSGATIVSTPIPTLVSLSREGFYGTIANSFSSSDLASALWLELELWRQGKRKSAAIAADWQPILDARSVAKKFLNLLNS